MLQYSLGSDGKCFNIPQGVRGMHQYFLGNDVGLGKNYYCIPSVCLSVWACGVRRKFKFCGNIPYQHCGTIIQTTSSIGLYMYTASLSSLSYPTELAGLCSSSSSSRKSAACATISPLPFPIGFRWEAIPGHVFQE